uniref:Alpha/beta fold hydrolase n=1 Tax=Schlesneria paludicola TaxID=360056 RepID=A0A7C4LP86_9PLAN
MMQFQVDDLPMRAIDEGHGQPLVFLHGFPLDHSMWDYQRRAFRANCRVLIPDQRGFGRTPAGERQATIDQFAADVAGLLDAAGVHQPVVLCGLSMGGCVTLAFAHRYPERLKALILCDARAATDTPEQAANRLKLAERVLTEGPRIVAEAMLPRLFAAATNERQPRIVDAVRNVILATSARGIAGGLRALAGRSDATPWLASICVPALLIVGEEDIISPPAEMRGMAAAMPNGRCVIIPQAGHMAPLEQPEPVNAAIQEFLAQLA